MGVSGWIISFEFMVGIGTIGADGRARRWAAALRPSFPRDCFSDINCQRLFTLRSRKLTYPRVFPSQQPEYPRKIHTIYRKNSRYLHSRKRNCWTFFNKGRFFTYFAFFLPYFLFRCCDACVLFNYECVSPKFYPDSV